MSDTALNIYEKLQKVRVALQGEKIKKSGANKHSNYGYYELSDFMPSVNRLFLEHRLFSQVTFTQEVAALTIIDIDKPEDEICFTSPMAEAKLPACHPIQNMGAVQTYQRRYLYINALEIVEQDAIDANTVKEDKPPSDLATDGQVKKIHVMLKKAGGSADKTKEHYKVSSTKELTKKQASELIEKLQQKLDEQEANNE